MLGQGQKAIITRPCFEQIFQNTLQVLGKKIATVIEFILAMK